ncbi:hypothetical protein T484DRAFT_1815104 [Baffinella frigidus]|nr:hypothetical protein T484DRAFT_1815104 [Cryptophyta sp. CCMP2293]
MAHMASSVDVFFSCVPADRERVQHVREMIEKAGYSCWWDADKTQSSKGLLLQEAAEERQPWRRAGAHALLLHNRTPNAPGDTTTEEA